MRSLAGLLLMADQGATVETTPFFFDGEPLTMLALESSVHRPDDPRVHMALKCASASCPEPPRPESIPDGLEAQRGKGARQFCNTSVIYDAARNTASLWQIFEWYAADFGGAPAKVIELIEAHRTHKVSAGANLSHAERDWSLHGPSLHG